MKAVYTDLHIHTSDNADSIKSDYDMRNTFGKKTDSK